MNLNPDPRLRTLGLVLMAVGLAQNAIGLMLLLR